MPISFSKYLALAVLIWTPFIVHANLDSTKTNFFWELNFEYHLGRSSSVGGPRIHNQNLSYGIGANIGYKIRPTHTIKIGMIIHQLSYLFESQSSRITLTNGTVFPSVTSKEEIWMKAISSGIIYTKEFTDRFSIDLESFLYFKIFDEIRKREIPGITDFEKEGLIVSGVSHATKDNFYRFSSSFNYKVSPEVAVGITLGITTEKITTPRLAFRTLNTAIFGVSLTYLL